MVKPDPWRVLGIAPTPDVRLLKKAYAARLKRTNPEDDAEGFQELRQAYETVLAFARWQQAQQGGVSQPRPSDTPPRSPPPKSSASEAVSEAPRLRAIGSEWALEAAALLQVQVERLLDNAEQRTSEAAWNALLANESLWNVDTRQRFEHSLIELLLRQACVLSAAIWCQLEAEFHLTEQALSLYRARPREAVDRLLARLEQAPIDHAAELCGDGRYAEARALLEPIASGLKGGGEVRIGAARRVLSRCAEEEEAAHLMARIERLRADKHAWRSTTEWRALLENVMAVGLAHWPRQRQSLIKLGLRPVPVIKAGLAVVIKLGLQPVPVIKAALAVVTVCLLIALISMRLTVPPQSVPPRPNYEALRTQGFAALDAKQYAKAVNLLQAASAKDPELKDVFEGLGRALNELGHHDEAVAAFTRQVDVAPHHERAYAWRAHVLIAQGRWKEAEKDLLIQIAVAPTQAWSFERLGERRMFERRFAEAADLYARAAAIEPREARSWLDLGVAQAEAERPAEARQSLEKSMSLLSISGQEMTAGAPEDWMRVVAARTYEGLGDLAKAGELARSALTPLSRRLNRLRPGAFGEADLYWVDMLHEAWTLVGRAALGRGDTREAERYLEAAWKLGMAPPAAEALAAVREKQGRTRDRDELLRLAATIKVWAIQAEEPVGFRPNRAIPDVLAQDRVQLEERRSTRLAGPVLGDLAEDVLLLADADGRVEAVRRLSAGDSMTLDRQVAQLEPIRLTWPRPDREPFRVVRRARLECSGASGCLVSLGLPRVRRLPLETADIRIVSLDANEALPLIAGRRVSIAVKVHYEINSGAGVLKLEVTDQTGRSKMALTSQTVTERSGEVTLGGSYTVPAGATRVDVLVPLHLGGSSNARTVATGSFAVETR